LLDNNVSTMIIITKITYSQNFVRHVTDGMQNTTYLRVKSTLMYIYIYPC